MGKVTISKPDFYIPDMELKLSDSATKTTAYTCPIKNLKGNLNRLFKLILHITAIDSTDGDETYKIKIEQSSNATFSADVDTLIEEIDIPRASTVPCIAFDNVIFKLTKQYFRFTITPAGTTPSITFSSYLSPVD